MSYPRLNTREVRQHPAVITRSTDLRPGTEVAIGYVIPPIGRRTRCGQALAGMLLSRPESQTRVQALFQGYAFTPAWGIVMNQRGAVKWVNPESTIGGHRNASFEITHTTDGMPLGKVRENAAVGMDALTHHIQGIPRFLNVDQEPDTFELIAGFDTLGLAPASGLDYSRLIVDVAKLS